MAKEQAREDSREKHEKFLMASLNPLTLLFYGKLYKIMQIT